MEEQKETVNIIQAAQILGVSDKTVRRWIHAGKLKASFPQINRCEIVRADLDPLLYGRQSRPIDISVEQRFVALERQVRILEQEINRLKQTRPARAKRQLRTTGPLPARYVSLQKLASLHNMPQHRVQSVIEMHMLPVQHGTWTQGEEVVTEALDERGQRAFYDLFHDVPPFMTCLYCPHEV
jgi:excisionase family DNA binding protein